MKKLLLATHNTYLVVTMLLVLFSSYRLEAQLTGDLRREILVYIQPNALAFPSLERGNIGIENLSQVSTPLRETFTRFGVQTMAKAFPNFTDADTLKTREDGVVVKLPQFSRIFKVYVADESDIDSAVSALSKIPGVLYAHKNGEGRRNSDPTYGNQWFLKNTGQGGGTVGEDIKAEDAWQIFTGSSSVKIAILDGGVDTDHQELFGKATGDLYDPVDALRDHGTLVAGVAAAKANNGYGGRGVDWNAQILSEIVFNASGYMGDGRAAQAITEAVNDGAHVINNSWGTPYHTTLAFAMSYAYKMNRVSVASMGNDGIGYAQMPAEFPIGVIAVGSTQDDGTRDPASTYGNHIDVVAPGGTYNTLFNARDIWSSKINDSYGWAAGTSMAAPVVSGIASLLKGYNSNLYNDDIENIIKLSADDKGDPGWDQFYGHGRVNAKKALERLGANNSGYVINHATAYGGTDQGASSYYYIQFFGAPGLSDGLYKVKRHEVRKSVNFSWMNSPAVWGRGVATNGWAADWQAQNFGLGWCDIVPGTLTSTGATLRTYVYEVWTWWNEFLGWYPTTPGNVNFAYTVHGIPQPLTANITGPSELVWKDWGMWTANYVGGNGTYTYEWRYRDYPSGSWSGVLSTSQQYTRQMPNNDIELQVKVTSAGQSVYDTHIVTLYEEGGPIDPRIGEQGAETAVVPESFGLSQNYPNPFNPETEITFSLPEPSIVKLTVLDILGREVAILEDGHRPAGYRSVHWNGRNRNNEPVSSGMYFYRLTAVGESGKSFAETRKMLMTK